MPQRGNGGNGGNGRANSGTTFVLKEWIAIGIAAVSFIFSAGGWYFKVTELEKRLDATTEQLSTQYVRKDVLGAQLNDIQRQLMDQSVAIQKMDVKLDSVSVAVSLKK